MTVQHWLWGADGACLALAVLAGVAESRRTKRRSFDGYGWVPWRGVQMFAIFAMVAFTVFAMKGF